MCVMGEVVLALIQTILDSVVPISFQELYCCFQLIFDFLALSFTVVVHSYGSNQSFPGAAAAGFSMFAGEKNIFTKYE